MKAHGQYKSIQNNWSAIKRHNDPKKGIAPKARLILSSALYQIKKYGHAILTHDALVEITETKNHQNCILIKQLGFILDAVFFRSLVENDKKYRDGYKLTFTKNAEEILENPEQYFTNFTVQNSLTSANKISDVDGNSFDRCENKFADISDKIRRSPDPLLIYKKKERKNDINDHRENQPIKNDFDIEEKTNSVASHKLQNNDYELNKQNDYSTIIHLETEYSVEETKTTSQQHSAMIEDVAETQIKTQKKAQLYQYSPVDDKVTRTDENGKEFWGIPLLKYRYSKSMLEDIRLNSNKQHFTHDRIAGLFKHLADKYPNKLIIGGKKGFIDYMTKVLNGEKEYTKEETLTSINDARNKEREELEWILANNNQVQFT